MLGMVGDAHSWNFEAVVCAGWGKNADSLGPVTAHRILSRSLMKLEAIDVSFFPVSPAIFLREDRS